MINLNTDEITAIGALLVHASKVDENYTNHEKKIIIDFINKYSKDNGQVILKKAESLEKDSNQILNYTRILKNKPFEFKSDIVKELWKIILSDKNADQFENNFMRRLSGLIYIEDKICGELKLQFLNKI